LTNEIKITELSDGGCLVEMDGEKINYSKEEVEEMERDYLAVVGRREAQNMTAEQKQALNNDLIKLISMILSIKRSNKFLVRVSIHNDIGMDVFIYRRTENKELEPIRQFWDVDTKPEQLQEAMAAVEAIRQRTYTGGTIEYEYSKSNE